MPVLFRRSLLRAATLPAVAALLPLSVLAEPAWPAARPITLIVPFSAGGPGDTQARWIAQKLGERLQQTVAIDNVPGAGGVLGVSKAVAAKADGYTLLLGSDSPVSVAPLVSAAVQYDATKDLAPIGLVATAPVLLLARPGLPARSLDAFIALAREQPGRLSYGTPGVGSVLHLAMEMLQERAKLRLVHVPFRGDAQTSNDLMSAQVDLGVLGAASAVPLVQHKKLQALGVSAGRRLAALPEVPAFAEAKALQGLEVRTWTGLLAPARTPAPIVQRLAAALQAVLQQPEVQQRLKDSGATPGQGAPEGFAAWLRQEKAAYGAIVQRARIQQE